MMNHVASLGKAGIRSNIVFQNLFVATGPDRGLDVCAAREVTPGGRRLSWDREFEHRVRHAYGTAVPASLLEHRGRASPSVCGRVHSRHEIPDPAHAIHEWLHDKSPPSQGS